jgi:hypothetical protein
MNRSLSSGKTLSVGVHGADERVSVENLGFGLRLYTGVSQERQGGMSVDGEQ